MTKKSDEFEKLNARIRSLVMGSEASVEWNGKIPDPDSPKDLRQIDVLITTADGRRIAVECRDRSGIQTVMWIEELAGRKESLGLDGMIAVAMNGFRPLAAKKAARFGIALYDFKALTNTQIASWSGASFVRTRFLQFNRLDIVATMAKGMTMSLPLSPSFECAGKDGYHAVMAQIRESLDPAQVPTTGRVTFDPSYFAVEGITPLRLAAQYDVAHVDQKATCTTVLMHDRPGLAIALRDVSVEHFDHSVRELISHNGNVHLMIDVERIVSPSNSILDQITIECPTQTSLKQYELVGSRRLVAPLNTVALAVTDTTV